MPALSLKNLLNKLTKDTGIRERLRVGERQHNWSEEQVVTGQGHALHLNRELTVRS